MPGTAHVVWWHSDGGALPSGDWQFSGTATPLLETDGVEIDGEGAYQQQVVGSDTNSGRDHADTLICFQVRIRGYTDGAAWASGASPIGFWIDDGRRQLAVSVGNQLQLINRTTGAVLATVAPWPWLTAQVLLLIHSRESWQLWADGQLLTTLACDAAAVSAGVPATVGFGCLDSSGSAKARFEQVEICVGGLLAPQHKIERWFLGMPIAVQSRWTGVARAITRATLGILEGAVWALSRAFQDVTAARSPVSSLSFTGAELPTTWTLLESADLSVVRQRIRIDAQGVDRTGMQADVGSATDTDEHTAAVTAILRSSTPDAQGRAGLHIQVDTGLYVVTAQLLLVATDAYAYVLTDEALSGALTEIGARWPIDPLRLHRVEVQVLGEDYALLLVDGAVVERLPVSAFPTSAGTALVEIACPEIVAVLDVEHGLAERRQTDLSRRPMFLNWAVERQIFTGGRERNDELSTWVQHRHDVQRMRGTTQGIIVELRRLTTNENAAVVRETRFAGWYLERSFPEVTPIWLEATDLMYDVFVEFGIGCLHFTPQQLADLAARYLVPASVLELRYFVCLATTTTANSSVPAPGTTRFVVASTDGFSVGDMVTIRDATNTTYEDQAVLAIDTALLRIDTAQTNATYLSGSIVRKTLSHT